MDQKQTVELFEACEVCRAKARTEALAAGKDKLEAEWAGHEAAKTIWNAWAEQMLAARKALEEAGKWATEEDENGNVESKNDDTAKWMEAAVADFSALCLWPELADREKPEGEEGIATDTSSAALGKTIRAQGQAIMFPGFIFPGDTWFLKTQFMGDVGFRGAQFRGAVGFDEAQFWGTPWFWETQFVGNASFWRTQFRSGAAFMQSRFTANALFQGAKFLAHVGFDGAHFNRIAYFWETHFRDGARFNEARFNNAADFDQTNFSSTAHFQKVEFLGNAKFEKAIFGDGALFHGTHFAGDATFRSAQFEREVAFEGTKFVGTAVFSGTQFADDVRFLKAEFAGDTGFQDAQFGRGAYFDSAKFASNAIFALANFRHYTSFEYAHFRNGADFNAIRSDGAFTMDNATFDSVPDFIQAHFSEAPRLDNLKLSANPSESSLFRSFRPRSSHSGGIDAKFRALRRLAVQGHDHENERLFLKGEICSRRGTADRAYHAAFWFGYGYEILSDFGGSIARPAYWGALSVLTFAALYSWLAPGACPRSDLEAFGQAFFLSLKNAVLLISWDSVMDGGKTTGCFKPPEGVWPVLGFGALQMLQKLISAVLWFLLLLAARNRFKIK